MYIMYVIFQMHRVRSRAALIQFREPRIGPVNDDEDEVYE